MSQEVHCYNHGCGKTFNPDENTEQSCQFHPGVPVFHDALKGWSCCKKRSTDFTEFLNIPGCTTGCHSNVKPAAPLQPKVESKKNTTETIAMKAEEETITESGLKHREPEKPAMARPAESDRLVNLPVTIATNLKKALERLNDLKISDPAAGDNSVISANTTCKNKGCQLTYGDADGLKCRYHPGDAIFHEGYKYWSCCQQKTTDFQKFLDQGGCEIGSHKWIDDTPVEKKLTNCRYDWYETGSFVTISIYAKNSLPAKSHFKANGIVCEVALSYDGGESLFEKRFVLKGIVNEAASSVKMTASKVEVSLKKKELVSWGALELAQ